MPLEPTLASSEEGVVVVRGAASGFAQEILTGRHRFAADEPSVQRSRLLEIAERCPVRRTLESEIEIRSQAA